MAARWRKIAKGRYADTLTQAVIVRDGRLWKRTGGGGRANGWYPTLTAAQGGSSGRTTWRRRSNVHYVRIDDWHARSSARQGAARCWRLHAPDGTVPAYLVGNQSSRRRSNLFGSLLAAQRAAPKLSGESRGGRREPSRRAPDRASRQAEGQSSARRARITAAVQPGSYGTPFEALYEAAGSPPVTVFHKDLRALERAGKIELTRYSGPLYRHPHRNLLIPIEGGQLGFARRATAAAQVDIVDKAWANIERVMAARRDDTGRAHVAEGFLNELPVGHAAWGRHGGRAKLVSELRQRGFQVIQRGSDFLVKPPESAGTKSTDSRTGSATGLAAAREAWRNLTLQARTASADDVAAMARQVPAPALRELVTELGYPPKKSRAANVRLLQRALNHIRRTLRQTDQI